MRMTWLLAATVVALCATAHAGGLKGWHTDLKKAKKEARKTGKPIMIDFDGSDWWGYCIKLTREVFETKAFKKWAKENVVLYHADFPRGKKPPRKQAEANEALKAKFKVRGFPTVVLMTHDEKELGRQVGYKAGSGPEAYLKSIQPHVDKAADHMWMTDWKEARALARKQRKPMLVSFDGSDWWGYCIKLTREVFSTTEFKTWARKNVVLVHIDSPRKTKLPDDLQKQNDELKRKFGIRGFPTVLFLDPRKEKVLGRSGYLREKGPEAWIKHAEKELK